LVVPEHERLSPRHHVDDVPYITPDAGLVVGVGSEDPQLPDLSWYNFHVVPSIVPTTSIQLVWSVAIGKAVTPRFVIAVWLPAIVWLLSKNITP
jgi:hypothetical protein